MVEIFRTNVRGKEEAFGIISLIHEAFREYSANFDLEDSDRILRIKSKSGEVHVSAIMELVRKYGFKAEILPDDYPL